MLTLPKSKVIETQEIEVWQDVLIASLEILSTQLALPFSFEN